MTRTSQNGFTITELMTVVLIASVLALAVAPSYRNFIAKQQVDAAARDLQTALMLVRSEAVKRNANAHLLRNTNWGDGLAVVTSLTPTPAPTFSNCLAGSDSRCVRVFPSVASIQMKLVDGGGTDVTATTSSITYSKSGRSSQNNLTFQICPTDGITMNQRLVRISATGLPQITYGGNC